MSGFSLTIPTRMPLTDPRVPPGRGRRGSRPSDRGRSPRSRRRARSRRGRSPRRSTGRCPPAADHQSICPSAAIARIVPYGRMWTTTCSRACWARKRGDDEQSRHREPDGEEDALRRGRRRRLPAEHPSLRRRRRDPCTRGAHRTGRSKRQNGEEPAAIGVRSAHLGWKVSTVTERSLHAVDRDRPCRTVRDTAATLVRQGDTQRRSGD